MLMCFLLRVILELFKILNTKMQMLKQPKQSQRFKIWKDSFHCKFHKESNNLLKIHPSSAKKLVAS